MEPNVSSTSNIVPVKVSEIKLQVKEMIKFINQEAAEKIEELNVIADEEFLKEKRRFFKILKEDVDRVFQSRQHNLKTEMSCNESRLWNEYSLNLLRNQSFHVEDVFQKVEAEVAKMTRNEEFYRQILKMLIIQGLYNILEAEVDLVVRKQDQTLAESVLKECSEVHNKIFNRKGRLKVLKKEFLSDERIGGVKLTAQNGKFTVINTLDLRCRQVVDHLLPFIRNALFGFNKRRTYTK